MRLNLKELLKSNNISQLTLANDLDITQSAVNKYVLGKAEPNIDTLCKIADLFHITLDELVGRDTNLVNLACLDTKTQEVVKQVMELSGNQLDLALQFINALKK